MANYYVRYEGDFCDKQGDTIYIKIKKRSDVVLPVDRIIFTGEDNNPVKITYKDDGEDKIIPLNSSDCEINIKAVGDFELSSLYVTDEKEWLVEISGAWNWNGFLLPDSCTEPFGYKPYDVSVRATDGLGTINEIPFSNTLGKPYTDDLTDKDALYLALLRTGLTLPMTIGINMRALLQGTSQNITEQVHISGFRFQDSSGAAFSCGEVIRSILARYSARLFQWNGVWQITSSLETSFKAVKGWKYDNTGDFIGNVDNLVNDVYAGGINRDIRPVGDISLAKAYASSTAYYQFGYLDNKLENGDMNDFHVPLQLPVSWKIVQLSGVVYASTRESTSKPPGNGDYYIRVGGQGSGRVENEDLVQIRAGENVNMSMEMRFQVPANVGSNRFYFSCYIYDNNGNYYTRDGWRNTLSYFTVEYTSEDMIGGPNGAQVSVTFTVSPRAEDYKLSFGFLPVGQTNGNHYDTDVNNVGLSTSIDSVLKPAIGTFTRLRQSAAQTYVPDPILLLQGDDPNDQRTSQLIVNGQPTTSWSRGPFLGENISIMQAVADTQIRLHGKPYRIFQADFKDTGRIGINSILNIDLVPGSFMFLSGEFNLKSGVHSLKWAEILTGDVVYFTEIRSDDGTLTSKDGVSVGSPSGVGNGNNGGTGSEINTDGFIRNQSTLQVGAEYNISKGVINDVLVVPSKPAVGLVESQSALWVGNISGITNGGGGGGGDYVLPVATVNALGGIRIGSGLVIDPVTGITSVNGDLFDLTNYYTKAQSDSRFVNKNEADVNPTPGTILRRDANGYAEAGFFKSKVSANNIASGVPLSLYGNLDLEGYHYSFNPSSVRSFLGIGSGYQYNASVSPEPNTLALRNSSGHVYSTYFNTTSTLEETTADRLYGGYNGDGFIRALSKGSVSRFLTLGSASQYEYSAFEPAFSVLPISKGGTGSSNRTFVDFVTNETISGIKTFSNGSVFIKNLIVPSQVPSSLTSGTSSLWAQSLSGISNNPGGGSDYVLPISSAVTLGGVKIGTGLLIDPSGVLSINGDVFDLSNYYTKQQSDARFVNYDYLAANYYISSYINGNFLGINATAVNALGWNSQSYVNNEISGDFIYFMAFDGAGWKPTLPSAVKTKLGIGTAASYDINLIHRYNTFNANANTVPENTSNFTYTLNAPNFGALQYFGANGYGMQLNSSYQSPGNKLSFRTKNGDTSQFNPWYDIFHTGNLTFSTLPDPNTGVYRSASGYIYATYFNTNAQIESSGTINKIYGGYGTDGFIRPFSSDVIRTFLGVSVISTANSIVARDPSSRIEAVDYYSSSLGGYLSSIISAKANSADINLAYVLSRGNTASAGQNIVMSSTDPANGYIAFKSSGNSNRQYTIGAGLPGVAYTGFNITDASAGVRFWLSDSGNIHIGYLSEQGHKLSVNGDIFAIGPVQGNRGIFGADSGVTGSVNSNGWFRSFGASGWVSQDYGGGIYMQDSTYIRTLGGKAFYCDNEIESPSLIASAKLGVPSAAPITVTAGRSYIWVGNLSGITN